MKPRRKVAAALAIALQCDNCGAIEKHHGIDAVNNGPLMCPLYMKNDGANWDGNYHRWRKWKPKVIIPSGAS